MTLQGGMLSSGNRGVISSTSGVLVWVPRLASKCPDRFFVYPVANIHKMMDFSMLMDSGSIMYASEDSPKPRQYIHMII